MISLGLMRWNQCSRLIPNNLPNRNTRKPPGDPSHPIQILPSHSQFKLLLPSSSLTILSFRPQRRSMDFHPNDDPFGDHPGRPDKRRVVRFPPKKKAKVIGSSSEGNIQESHEGNIQESHGDEQFERQGNNPQKPLMEVGSSSKSLEEHYVKMSGVKGNPIAIFFDGLHGSMGWLIESGDNQNITLNGNFVDFQFSGLFRLGDSSEERIRVLKRIREACGGSSICYICVPIHFENGNRVTIQADILTSGFAACLFIGFRYSLAAGFYLEYRPFITDQTDIMNSNSFYLFVQADESSMLASFGKYDVYLHQIWPFCSLFDRCLPTSAFDPTPTRFDEVNANYLGILTSFLEKFAKVCTLSLSNTNVIVVGGSFSSREMLLDFLRARFPNILVLKYSLETIVKGILVGGLGLENQRENTGETLEVLEINFVGNMSLELLCMSCGMTFGRMPLDARMYSQVDGRRLDVGVGEADEWANEWADEGADEWANEGADEWVDEGADEGVLADAEADEGADEEVDAEADEEDVGEDPWVTYCEGCKKPVCTGCKKLGCQVCRNKANH